jgi:hypothetical protein
VHYLRPAHSQAITIPSSIGNLLAMAAMGVFFAPAPKLKAHCRGGPPDQASTSASVTSISSGSKRARR